jgi:hypothetical protein
MADIQAGTLYAMNQSIMQNQNPMTKEERGSASKKIKAYFMENIDEKYFMLLCKELSDYTIFNISSTMNCGFATNEFNETINNRGEVLSIADAPGNAFEIWIRMKDSKEVHAYYLFPYKLGVIEC